MSAIRLLPPVSVPVNVLPHPCLSIDEVRLIAHHNRFGIRIRRTREGTRILFTRPAGEFELDFTDGGAGGTGSAA